MGTYRNEEDMPKFEKIGSGKGGSYQMHDCGDLKKEASDQSYGQGGREGCISDSKKINAQFFHAYTDDAGY